MISLASAFVFELLYNLICYEKFKIENFAFVLVALTYSAICEVKTPWFVPIIAMAFATIFVKMMFGGYANNIFSLAGSGALFVGIIFAGVSNLWTANIGASVSADAFARIQANDFSGFKILDFVKGQVNAPIGCAFFIVTLVAGLYLIIAKVIDWKMPLVAILSYAGMALLLTNGNFVGVAVYLLAGCFLFVTFMMLPDYATSPNTKLGQVIYALVFGLTASLVVRFTMAANLGIIASLLLANSLSPLLDRVIRPRYFGEGK